MPQELPKGFRQEWMQPHPSRCSAASPHWEEILRRHQEAVDAGRSQYADPATGYAVFTAVALWQRGYCCESGCRHCPYLKR